MALEIFGDFQFVGGEDNYLYQDAQTCINYYPELAGGGSAKTAISLRGTPGLIQLAAAPGGGAPGNQALNWPTPSTVTNLPVRGMWVLPGQTTALVVIANTCYLCKALSQGNTNSPGTISLTSVGTLQTFSGPVSIRDNNTGGYAFIVDGPNGYTYNLSTQAFAQINDSNFVGWGATTQAFIDGWQIFSANQSSTGNQQIFFTNSPIYSITFNGTFFDLKDGASDNLMCVMENKEQLWLIGERTTEIWYNAGGALFAFQRLGGGLQQTGCKAAYSVSRLKTDTEDCLIWFGRNELGENIVVKTQGFNTQVVSTPAVSDAIATYGITSDAIGFCYEEDGHQFYQLTFPSADKTWVYDSTMPPQFAWHQRASYDPYTQSYHRHRANCFMNFAGMRIVGDYQNGALYQLTRSAYTDAGWPIKAQRRSPYIWNKDNRRRVQMAQLQVEFAPGVGATQVSYPQTTQTPNNYFANAVSFLYNPNTPFTNPLLSKATNFTGLTSNKTGSISVWVRLDGTTPAPEQNIFTIAGSGITDLQLNYSASGHINNFGIIGRNSAGTKILDISTSANYSPGTTWYNILASWNLATGSTNIYVNNVSDLTTTTATNDTINYGGANGAYLCGIGTIGDSLVSLSEFWFNNSFIDFSVSANRALFNSGGFPVSLGINGQTPTGSSPILYLKNNAINFNGNNGIGGNLTIVNGPLVNASTSPSGQNTGGIFVGIGSNPQAKLRISRDYGTTYGEPIYSPIGQIGNFVNRTIWRKLGWTRGTVVEIEVIDPVKRDIVGATLRAYGD